MDSTRFPPDFPDIGGMRFDEVAKNPKYIVFCTFVVERMENCTGLFSEFQAYLNKRSFNVKPVQFKGHTSSD